jgi:hypothetical protein
MSNLSNQQMRAIAQELSGMGRYGDSQVVHVNPKEIEMLKRMGGSGTINPKTGLREFATQTQKDLNDALKASGNVWTKEVNDLAKKRDAEKNQVYDDTTKTYSSTTTNNKSGGNKTSNTDSSGDKTTYNGIIDAIDGGGKNGSGSYYFNGTSSEYKQWLEDNDLTDDRYLSGDEAADQTLFRRITGYDDGGDITDGGGMGKSGATYGHGNFGYLDTDKSGKIDEDEVEAANFPSGGLPGGIDGNDDSTFSTVMNIVGLVTNPVAYLAGKGINSYFDVDGVGNMFTKNGEPFLNLDSELTPEQLAAHKAHIDSLNDNDDKNEVVIEDEIEEEVAETTSTVTAASLSEGMSGPRYRSVGFSSRPERRKFIKYDYSDGQANPVRSYTGNAKPFHVSTSRDSMAGYAITEAASNAVDQMISSMPTSVQESLQGEISIQQTTDNKLALYVGDETSGYIEATYDPAKDGLKTALQDVSNMLAYSEASGDYKIDAGFTGRVRSAERFQGYSDEQINNQITLLETEAENYEENDPLQFLWLERLQELRDELFRRDGGAEASTSAYAVNGVTRAVAEVAKSFLV